MSRWRSARLGMPWINPNEEWYNLNEDISAALAFASESAQEDGE